MILHINYINNSPFGAKICSHISPWTSSVQRAKLQERCELWGTDNVQGQIRAYFRAKWRILRLTSGKNVMNNLLFTEWYVYYSVFSDMISWKIKTCSFFCNNHIHFLILKWILKVGCLYWRVWKLGNITWVYPWISPSFSWGKFSCLIARKQKYW